MSTATMPEAVSPVVAMTAPTVATVATESNNERRHRMRAESQARHAAMILAGKNDSLSLKSERDAAGVTGRDGYVQWTRERAEQVRGALLGSMVTATVTPIGTTARTTRILLTGVATVDVEGRQETIAFRGEASVADRDAFGRIGGTVTLTLADRGIARNGQRRPGLACESRAADRVTVRGSVSFSRFARVLASTL